MLIDHIPLFCEQGTDGQLVGSAAWLRLFVADCPGDALRNRAGRCAGRCQCSRFETQAGGATSAGERPEWDAAGHVGAIGGL